MSAWSSAPGIRLPTDNQALKARLNLAWLLNPKRTLIEINAVPAKQLAVFLLKRPRAMMLSLRLDVLQHGIEM
jgi:hypothetical protein